VTGRQKVLDAIEAIKAELTLQKEHFVSSAKLIEAQRIEQRTRFDLEMMTEIGFCKGIENYSRHLSGRSAGEPPPTLLDYMPPRSLVFIDESHVTIPQVGGMYKGDRARKEISSTTGSGCRRRSTTGRCASTSSSGSCRRRCSCRRLRPITRRSTRGRWSSRWCGRPGSSIRAGSAPGADAGRRSPVGDQCANGAE
jgi:hypothetical protein